jgi:hypothetical protein
MKFRCSPWFCLDVCGDDVMLCPICAAEWQASGHAERAELLVAFSALGVSCWIAQRGRMDTLPMKAVEPGRDTLCRWCGCSRVEGESHVP